jgi:hypothetical protein
MEVLARVAATEGMRKTQSADEIQDGTRQAIRSSVSDDGHQSDSAIAPTRERKKGASPLPIPSARNFFS